jgi:transposase
MDTNHISIGLDLGERRIAGSALPADGEVLAEETISNTRECPAVMAQRWPGATMTMETGTHSPWVSRLP